MNSTTTAVYVSDPANITVEFVGKAPEMKGVWVMYRNTSVLHQVKEEAGIPSDEPTKDEIRPLVFSNKVKDALSVTDQRGIPLLYLLHNGTAPVKPVVDGNGDILGFRQYLIVFGGYKDGKTVYKVDTVQPYGFSVVAEKTIIL